MDFSQVNRITTPYGDLVKITDSKDNILWRVGYSMNLVADPPEGGHIKTDKSYVKYGDYLSISAIPSIDYEFIKWSNGSTLSSITIGPVVSDISLTATFSEASIYLITDRGEKIITNENDNIIVKI